MARGVVLTAQAFSRHRVAVLSVAVALAGLAAGKSPIPREAPVTLPTIYALETVALASDGVTEGTDRPLYVAVTGFASVGAKAEGAGGTPVAGPSNHVRAALALASVGVTHRTQRALRITFTSKARLVNQGRDAEDDVSADVRHRCFYHTPAVLQTPVALEGLPGTVGHLPVSRASDGEDVQRLTVGHENK